VLNLFAYISNAFLTKFIYPPATQNCRQAWSRVLFAPIAYMEDEIDEKARHLNIGSTDEDGMTSTEV